ncbi:MULTISPECIES: hypothetical protein [Cryobacterium]|uniref:Uncharacterized protein n=1 Tax=Cryobacterium breve TaxID=1259258 RepID=A0ABY2JEH7_9MICO|nr:MULTISPECIES: hypothetical protein [Cryobacterium]TFC94508.1 hypothetical protein E3T20_08410 [Cryobacterium sp. TmT3-12]TFD01984.1 hypothetical protein E3O65_00330 [Cryobacterium breve]
MSDNEEGRQNEIADELAKVARLLSHSTRSVPRPSDSYELLASLRSAQDSLALVYAQLAAWHQAAVGEMHYSGRDALSIPGVPATATGAREQVTLLLKIAAASAAEAADLVSKAHSANGAVRWFDEVKETA